MFNLLNQGFSEPDDVVQKKIRIVIGVYLSGKGINMSRSLLRFLIPASVREDVSMQQINKLSGFDHSLVVASVRGNLVAGDRI